MNAASSDENANNAAHQQSSGAAERSIAVQDNQIDSRNLFIGTREITIAHGSDVYRLRLTAQNKLILTK
jgi:hemin uptake protein HemP